MFTEGSDHCAFYVRRITADRRQRPNDDDDSNDINEIEEYQNARWIGSIEVRLSYNFEI